MAHGITTGHADSKVWPVRCGASGTDPVFYRDPQDYRRLDDFVGYRTTCIKCSFSSLARNTPVRPCMILYFVTLPSLV